MKEEGSQHKFVKNPRRARVCTLTQTAAPIKKEVRINPKKKYMYMY